MQNRFVVTCALLTALGAAMLGAVRVAEAQMYGSGMMGPGYGQSTGPNMMYGQGYGPGMVGCGMMHGPGYGHGCGRGMMRHGMMCGRGPSMMYGQGYGPGMMGPGMMGPGMMNGPGYGQGYGLGMMGPGMMGPGYGMHRPGGFHRWRDRNISVDDAKNYFERWVASQGNSRLKLGEVKEKDADTITVDIVTKDNSLVQRFQVNRHNGVFRTDEEG